MLVWMVDELGRSVKEPRGKKGDERGGASAGAAVLLVSGDAARENVREVDPTCVTVPVLRSDASRSKGW